MPPIDTPPAAPRTAWAAAQQLADEGKHVHYVAEAQSVCVSEHCKPARP